MFQAHVTHVPGLVAVAGDVLPAFLIAQDKAEAPAVFRNPRSALGVGKAGGQSRAGVALAHVHGHAQLMLAGAGPGHVFVRLFLAAAHALELVVVNVLLLLIAAVAADGDQGHARLFLAGGKHLLQGGGGLRAHAAQGTAHVRLNHLGHVILTDAIGAVHQKKRTVNVPLGGNGLQGGSDHHGACA